MMLVLAAGAILIGCGGGDDGSASAPGTAVPLNHHNDHGGVAPPAGEPCSFCGKSAAGWKPLRVRTGSLDVQAATSS